MNLIGLIELLMLRKLRSFYFFTPCVNSLNVHNAVFYIPAIYTKCQSSKTLKLALQGIEIFEKFAGPAL